MTTRELLNKVLRGLRQYSLLIDSGTTEVTDDYILMLLQLINEAKEECEEVGWPWQSLRITVTFQMDAGDRVRDLTISDGADVDTNDRSQLLYENVTMHGATESFRNSDRSMPQVFDVTDSSEERLIEISKERMERLHLTDADQTGQPVYFCIYPVSGALRFNVWPTPDANYTISARVYVPQSELTADSLDTELSIPARPVYLKALWKANVERGEELGRPGGELERSYLDALGNATGREMSKVDSTIYLED